MENQARAWLRLADLYLQDELELSEIAKASMIFSSAGFFGSVKDIRDIGINVFDNTEFNSALVYGVLRSLSKDDEYLISYTKLGEILSMHAQTAGKAAKHLMKENVVSRQDFGSSGSRYKILEDRSYAPWIFLFTDALVKLWQDEMLKAEIDEETKDIHFQRGMEVLKEELRKKFYRPRKNDN